MNLFKNFIKKLSSWFLGLSVLKKGFVVALLVLIGWLAYANLFGAKNTAPQYQTATAERGTLVTSVTSSGTVSSGNNAAITTQATGIVADVYVKNGDYVQQGDTIALLTLDSSSQQKQTAAYANYLSAQNNLNAAKAKMNSLQSALFKANQAFITDRGIDNPSDAQKADPKYIEENAEWLQAESDYNNQQGVIAEAEASFSSAALSYAQTSATITAPIAGYISNVNITPGLPIVASSSNNSNSTGTSSTQTLGNITLKDASLTAAINLTEIDVTKVKVGEKVTITLDAFPDKTFTGKVSAIDTNGSVSSGVTSYPTTITFDTAPENVYPNMAVNATIITAVKDDVILVPTSAVQTQNGQSTVRVMNKGNVSQLPVEIGLSSDTQTEIVSGLSEGQTVVVGTISTSTNRGTTGAASPFGGTGFGGNRGFGGGGGGGGAGRAVFIQRAN